MAILARFNRTLIKVAFIGILCGTIYSTYLYTPTASNYNNYVANFNRSKTGVLFPAAEKTVFLPNSSREELPPLMIPANETFKSEPPEMRLLPAAETTVFVPKSSRRIEPPPLRIPANETFKSELPEMRKATIDKLIQEGSLSNIPKDKIMLSGFPVSNRSIPCGKFPTIYDINYSSQHWQIYAAGGLRFLAKAAFLDTRVLNIQNASVRVVGMFQVKLSPGVVPPAPIPTVTWYCQLWFKGEPDPVVSPAKAYFHYDPIALGTNYDLLSSILTCHVPSSHLSKIPFSVSVVESPCSWSTVNLEVFYDNPRKRKDRFAICVKALDFPDQDISWQLIEWIELHDILGVGKIFLPELATTPDTKKVLEYYRKLDRIEVKSTTCPSMMPDQPTLQHEYRKRWNRLKTQSELVDFQECFFQNMYKYDYIALIDIDEIFVPRRHFNWVDMMNDLESKSKRENTTGQLNFSFRNVYYFYDASIEHGHFADIPKENLMLQHVRRTNVAFNNKGMRSKCFQSTEEAVGLYHHFPKTCFGSCKIYNVEEKDALMHHYKPLYMCPNPNCSLRFQRESVLDNTVWRYKDELIPRVNQVATHLQLIR